MGLPDYLEQPLKYLTNGAALESVQTDRRGRQPSQSLLIVCPVLVCPTGMLSQVRYHSSELKVGGGGTLLTRV